MFFHPSNSTPLPFGAGAKITKTEHEPALRMVAAVMDQIQTEIKEIIVDVKQRMVSARIQLIFDFKAVGDQPEERDYMIEYVWITEHDESGEKIVRMEEFCDAPRTLYMIGKAQMYAQEKEQ